MNVLIQGVVEKIGIQFLEVVQQELTSGEKCVYASKKKCERLALQNGFCKLHQRFAINIQTLLERNRKLIHEQAMRENINLEDHVKKRIKGDCVKEWLKTAVPQEATVLSEIKGDWQEGDDFIPKAYFSSPVLIHKPTEMMFRRHGEEYILIGKWNNRNGILRLTDADIALAEWKGWLFEKECVEMN